MAGALADIPQDGRCEPHKLKEIVAGMSKDLDIALLTLSELSRKVKKRRSGDIDTLLDHIPEAERAAHDDDVTKGILSLYHGHEQTLVSHHTNMMNAHTGANPASPKATRSPSGRLVSEFDVNVTKCLSSAGSYWFDALELASLTARPITCLGQYIEDKEGIVDGIVDIGGYIDDAGAFKKTFLLYLSEVDKLYRPEAMYHGSAHAVDVMSTMMWALGSEFFREWTSAPDRFMSLVAAAIHDVGHPGRNNVFYSRTWDLQLKESTGHLAIRYNDKSILENFHIALAFETLLSRNECNWFRLLKKSEGKGIDIKSYIRRGLIDLVLHTDMSKHGNNAKQLGEFGLEHQGCLDDDKFKAKNAEQQLEDKLFILGSTLHAVDVSNPAKPRPIMLAWTKRVLDEFWAQGDVERSLGFTSLTMLCDREVDGKKIPARQLGFIGFVVEPYWKSLAVVIPEMQEAVDQLAQNKTFWAEQAQKGDGEGAKYEELFTAANLTVSARAPRHESDF